MPAPSTGLILAYGPPDVEPRYTLYPTTAEVLAFQPRLTVCDSGVVPDPVKLSITGVSAAVLAKEMFPDAAPLLWGVKTREAATFWPGASVWGRDNPVRLNSALLEVADKTVTLDPAAVSVTVALLLVPTVTLPKFKALALEESDPAETPVPARAIFRYERKSFETIVIPPLTLPPAVGVKPTLKVMLWPLFRLNGRPRPFKANPAPVKVACEMVTAELPEFVNVSYCVWL